MRQTPFRNWLVTLLGVFMRQVVELPYYYDLSYPDLAVVKIRSLHHGTFIVKDTDGYGGDDLPDAHSHPTKGAFYGYADPTHRSLLDNVFQGR